MSPQNIVSETELAILDVLWETGPCPVRDIVDQLYDEYSRSLHATVQSLLDRLAKKGFVQRDTSGHAHRFYATVPRAEFVGRQLEQIMSSHFDGSISPMLHALVDHTKLKRKDRAAIQRLIDELDS